MAAIVDSSDDAIVSKNLHGIVTSWNRGAERIFGYTSSEMVGHSIERIFPEDRVHEEAQILDRLRRGERVDHFETKRRRRDGTIIDVSVTISPVKSSKGEIVGASKVARDISEQKAARDKLVLANKELLRADQMKSEFLSTLSHELRTPLGAILGWTQVAKESTDDLQEVAHALDVIERNARAQATMIEDLLDVSRVVAGKITLDVQPLDLSVIVAASIEAVQPAAEAKEIRVTSTFASVGGEVRGDKSRLQQAVWNLLSNAIKFTPKHGRVHVTIQRVNSHVEICVSDTGRGILPESLPFVFERFWQSDGSATRKHRGLGLGLSITKQLVESHGGNVRAASLGENRGATFTISLPIAVSHHEALAEDHGPSHKVNVDARSLQGVRVLAVDDEPDAVSFIKRIMEKRGAEVRTASSASDAIAALEDYTPHVILSDIGMPDEDGYSFMRRARELPHIVGVPAVALTALARSVDRTRALQAGFQSHLAKPVEPAELMAVVSSLVSLGEARGKSSED